MSNHVTPERFKALREQFHGRGTPEEARATLDAAAEDPDLPPILRLQIASAILDLRTGRSVQSTMARLRRGAGLDPDKQSKG